MELSRDPDVRFSYARDASGLEMIPDAVARPTTAADVVDVVKQARAQQTPITPAGAQTSTTAASIVDRGILLSMRAMSRTIDIDTVRRVAKVEPGLTIGALNQELAPLGLRFTPDPTSENEATIGGAIACNASGARSLRYGATRPHVRALTIVGGTAEITELTRPRLEKNTVGFHAAQDPVDWIVGSEGTLGVIVAAELSLEPKPARETGLAIPFSSELDALRFIIAAREQTDTRLGPHAECLEYFDGQALAIARDHIGLATWMAGASALAYLEQAFETDAGTDDVLDVWLALAERHGANAANIEAYDDAASLRNARRFRHAVPAFMNERGAARRPFGGRKVSTDWAVPYHRLPDALDASRRAVEAARVPPPVTYGHAGNGHPHQNFIAQDADELARINDAVKLTVANVLQMGGTVAAEHGLGKLKRQWLALQLSPLQLDVMRALKHAIDPTGIFAPGNVFP